MTDDDISTIIIRCAKQGLEHYLTDQTSYGRHDLGLANTRIIIEDYGSELVISTHSSKDGHRRFSIEAREL